MMYIGLDVHCRAFAMSVLNGRGRIVFEGEWETSCESLREAVGAVAGRKRVVLEESTVASWAYRVLKPHADEVVVADPWHNRLIGKDEKLDDKEAARKLARLLRSGDWSPVHHTDQLERQVFKELVLMYHDVVAETTRCKNRLKAKFQQHGVRCSTRELYRSDRRASWREQLPSAETRYQADLLWEALDQAEERRARLHGRLRRQAGTFEPIRRFLAVPGIGVVRAATFYALLDTPHRFATRGKLWAYCGVGLAQRSSGAKSEPAHLARRFNRHLKATIKGAALTAIQLGDNPFAAKHQRQRAEGMSAEKAWLSVSRSVASTLWAMWLTGSEYQPRPARDPGPLSASGRSAA
jgi:transposase